jgi:hypothetical protein
MIPVETIPGMGGREDKGEWWKRWIQLWYIQYIVRTFVNATIYPHPAQHKGKTKTKTKQQKQQKK